MSTSSKVYTEIDKMFIDEVCKKISKNQRVHRKLADGGFLHIDRQLPFLSIYRLNKKDKDQNTARLLKGESSYFIIPPSISKNSVSLLIKAIVSQLSEIFNGFLLLEIWGKPTDQGTSKLELEAPEIHIHADTNGDLVTTCDRLYDAFNKIKIQKKQANVCINYHRNNRPPKQSPLLIKSTQLKLNCYTLGVEFKTIYRNDSNNEFYPLVFQKFRTGFSYALKHAFFEFMNILSTQNPEHYHSMGSTMITKLTYKVDEQIAQLSKKIDFLLWVSPVNTEQCWEEFKKKRYARKPNFHYKPIPIDPAQLKKNLFSIDISKVHDPTLEKVFLESRNELDRKLSMVYERNTPNFLLGSMQLYGRVDDHLVAIAQDILKSFNTTNFDDTYSGKHHAKDFAKVAKQEIDKLCKALSPINRPKVIITNEVPGLMVSKGHLYVGDSVRIPQNRVNALIQHEVGTHIVTYLNGACQPLKIFRFGLPGYDELQEGMAVLSEYLVGQLSRPRIRMLAARVIAAKSLEDGAKFVDVFSLLHEEYHFDKKTAFRIVSRIFRGGGLTKDAIYLRGFISVINFLQQNDDIESLFIGKFSKKHIPLVRELIFRGILKKSKILPSYINDPQVQKRLRQIKQNLPLVQLLGV